MSRYSDFINQFETAILKADRKLSEVELIAVSKTKSAEEIENVINENHLSFGENKLQEVGDKWINLKAVYPNVRLHFIGSIQSRKVSAIYDSCDVIHSLDRIKIVKKFDEIESRSNKKREYFIQINTGNESQKSGVPLSEADNFIEQCLNEYKINIIGLMCIPPLMEKPSEHFESLRTISKKFNLDSLSMGMSSDYEEAINCGATHIRIGTHIFGKRN